MKTLEELALIRERMKDKVALRKGVHSTRIIVGMATCGITAGARDVLNAFVEEVANEKLSDEVTVSQMGCIGICRYEPVVEVHTADGKKTTYVNMTPERAKRVIAEHIKGGKAVEEYTLG